MMPQLPTSRRDVRSRSAYQPANTASLRVLDRIGMTLDHREEDDKGVLLYLSRIP